MAETIEVLNRSWHVEGQAVRPDHRMVAHTGFLTWARLLHPAVPPVDHEAGARQPTPAASVLAEHGRP
jgi:hypothetical protein